MNEQLFQVPATVQGVKTMSHRSLRITLDTQENLIDEQVAKLMALHEKTGWFTMSVEEIKPEDILSLPALTFEKDEKSPSQRLRSVLFILWQQKGSEGTFHDFYCSSLEKIIDQIKERLT